MWAVGCVAVVLLTSGHAFCDPITNLYSERLARNCNLEFLHDSREWQTIRERPKDFVKKLLVLDEKLRATAEEALQHLWFVNAVHKNDFEDLYQRTTKHWQPRIPKSKVVEFQDNGSIRGLDCSHAFLGPVRRTGPQNNVPVEPHCKPFPKQMHQALWPPRSPTKCLTSEALSAMERSSPSSAFRLRLRVESLSPSPRLRAVQPPDDPNTGRFGAARATSEPPFTRLPLQARGPARPPTPTRSFVKPGIFRLPNTSNQARQRSEMRRTAELPPSPKPPCALPVEIPATPIVSSPSVEGTDSVDTSPTDQNLSAIERTDTDPFDPSASATRLLDSVQVLSGGAPFNDRGIDGKMDAEQLSGSNISKLKRRPSTPFSTPTFKRRRGSSIFDLAEDADSDGQQEAPKLSRRPIFDLVEGKPDTTFKLPRLPLTNRSRFAPVSRTKSQAVNLYLPR